MSVPLKNYRWLDGRWVCPHSGHQADRRAERLFCWCCRVLRCQKNLATVTPIVNDASFRRYFRIMTQESHHIAMDSPPDKENNAAYMRVAERLAAVGVRVPQILAVEQENGFLLIDDLGHRHYLDVLTKDNAGPLYEAALAALVTIQSKANAVDLPVFDRPLLMAEMHLFADWLIKGHLKLSPPSDKLLEQSFDFLADQALKQSSVFVHRDYHSRNLIDAAASAPGILDFQDAVQGPYSYDVVSLLKDCYIRWPEEQIYQWAQYYYRLAVEQGLPLPPPAAFRRDFDLMGAQRHLKAAGIFARLFLRDKKPDYLAYIPRTLSYITDLNPTPASARYPELVPLTQWLRGSVLPCLQKQSAVPCKP